MRYSAPLVIGCALILLFGVGEALAGSAGGPPPTGSKRTGPAINGTILIGAQGTDVGGTFAIRLVKGTLQSGAVVISTRVIGYGTGCTTDAGVIANRFLGGPLTPGGLLSDYFVFGVQDDGALLAEIFQELGITIGSKFVPIITDVNNAVCSPSNVGGTLSLDVTIQFSSTK